ncbi:hypothetical protein HYC85_000745 [Camellia sinensis]|uniref:Uncharacterized protein n=1 Tax=Camellia sinensis TaxID=4442 RepID=A0A7J7I4W2_CAMSI|nr:hypothetical protein HYC85_000745 [Camellia sinensis]
MRVSVIRLLIAWDPPRTATLLGPTNQSSGSCTHQLNTYMSMSELTSSNGYIQVFNG